MAFDGHIGLRCVLSRDRMAKIVLTMPTRKASAGSPGGCTNGPWAQISFVQIFDADVCNVFSYGWIYENRVCMTEGHSTPTHERSEQPAYYIAHINQGCCTVYDSLTGEEAAAVGVTPKFIKCIACGTHQHSGCTICF